MNVTRCASQVGWATVFFDLRCTSRRSRSPTRRARAARLCRNWISGRHYGCQLLRQNHRDGSRLYCDYARLVRLQAQAESFSLLPHLKAGSVLRPPQFAVSRSWIELRRAAPLSIGDDICNLDWKVTMRTGKPHVRSYRKDRNVIVCVDQRSAMFCFDASNEIGCRGRNRGHVRVACVKRWRPSWFCHRIPTGAVSQQGAAFAKRSSGST